MLFRVEAAAICSGATKPSSTSMLACWNVPTGCKTTLVHKPLADMTFHKHHYKKRKTNAQNNECNNDYYKSFSVTGRLMGQMINSNTLKHQTKLHISS